MIELRTEKTRGVMAVITPIIAGYMQITFCRTVSRFRVMTIYTRAGDHIAVIDIGNRIPVIGIMTTFAGITGRHMPSAIIRCPGVIAIMTTVAT